MQVLFCEYCCKKRNLRTYTYKGNPKNHTVYTGSFAAYTVVKQRKLCTDTYKGNPKPHHSIQDLLLGILL